MSKFSTPFFKKSPLLNEEFASGYVSIQPSLQRLQSQAMAIQQSIDGKKELTEEDKYYKKLTENLGKKDSKDIFKDYNPSGFSFDYEFPSSRKLLDLYYSKNNK